tara:strand:+ start:134 stop:331 length:198 start_codon:yes stop_codon:yes gene_type:complete
MPKGKGTYGSKRGRPKKVYLNQWGQPDKDSKYLTSWGKLSDKEKVKRLLKERAKSDKQIKKMFRK